MRWSSRMGLLAAMALATTGCNLTWVGGVVRAPAPGGHSSVADTCRLSRMRLSTAGWDGGAGC